MPAAPFFLPIRYSPSGPEIGNPEGGVAVPGAGFPLRTVDLLDTAGELVFSGSDQVIPGSAGSFILEMANPKPGLRYGAQLVACTEVVGAGLLALDICAAWSVDGGVFFKNALAQENRFHQSAGAPASDTIYYNSPMMLGLALPAPVPSVVVGAATSLRVEFLAKHSGGAGQMSLPSTLFGRLVEYL